MARGILFAVAFVAALVAIGFGLRRLRKAGRGPDRGPFLALRRAFWVAAAAILGTSAACEGESSCYEPAWNPDDGGESGDVVDDADDASAPDADVIETSCYLPYDDGGTRDDAADTDDPDADEADGEAAPDAEPVDADPDAAGDSDEDVARARRPMSRQERWARRTLLRTAAVERYLSDPTTHPAVRELLLRDVNRLRRKAARIRRTAG